MSEFHSSISTATPHPATKQNINFDNGSTFEYSESRFWSKQFALSSDPPTNGGDSNDGIIGANMKAKFGAKHSIISTKSNFPIQCISFRPSAQDEQKHTQMAVACGPRVSLYPLKSSVSSLSLSWNSNGTPDRNISLGDIAHSTEYRADGRLLVIGCADGSIRVVDVKTRANLRTFQAMANDGLQSASSMGVRSVTWGRDGKKVVSAGDDAILRVWDISSEHSNVPLIQLKGHADSIRVCHLTKVPSLTTSDANSSHSILAVTGSYDHTIRLWDLTKTFYPANQIRQTTQNIYDSKRHEQDEQENSEDLCLSVMDHGAPVEDILILNDSHCSNNENFHDKKSLLVLSAGGTTIKLWNAMTGKLLTSITSHAKTISTMYLATPEQLRRKRGFDNGQRENEEEKLPRLITGGLDGLVRIHSLDITPSKYSIKVLHGIKHKSPITTLQMSPDSMRLIIGTSDGFLSIFHRSQAQQQHESQVQQIQNQKRKRQTNTPRGGTYSYFMRGADSVPEPDDHVLVAEKKKRMNRFDSALRQFRYSDALDEALKTKNPLVVTAILEELSKRRGLTQALSARDEETLEPLLSFITRYIAHPRYSSLLTGVSNSLCKIYGAVLGQSALIDELFRKLRRHVQKEIDTQRDLLRMVGQIDSYLFQTETMTDNNIREKEKMM